MPRRALGRGLDDLIPADALPEAQPVLDIPVNGIDPNPRQPKYLVNVDAVAAEAERSSRLMDYDPVPETLAERAARIRAKADGR